MAYIQLSKPVGPQNITPSKTSQIPSKQETASTPPDNTDGPCNSHSISDVTSSDKNEDLGNFINDNLQEDDSLSVDFNVQNELNKHFGFIPALTGSTGSAGTCTSSTASMSSAFNTSSDSTSNTYEVIPLDPKIVFDAFGYWCMSNKAYENIERKQVFKPGFCLGVWDSVTISYIDQTIDSEEANELIIHHTEATCSY